MEPREMFISLVYKSNTINKYSFTNYSPLNFYKMRIQTEVHNFEADVQLLQAVEQKVSKLENFFHRISEIQVILKSENLGFTKERVAEVKIHVPNGIIFSKESGRNFEGALSKAVIVLKLELLRYRAKRMSYGLV